MLTVLPLLVVLVPPQEALVLKLKPGDKLVYDLSVQSTFMNLDATGTARLTVAKKDGAKYTVSWPQVDFAANKGNFKPIVAGSLIITEKGRIEKPDAQGAMSLYLMQMALPDAPVSPGGTFTVKNHTVGPMKVDLTGKLEKVAEDGTATLVMDGSTSAQGGQLDLHIVSVFDVKKGIFRSSKMDMTSPQLGKIVSTYSFKLVQ